MRNETDIADGHGLTRGLELLLMRKAWLPSLRLGINSCVATRWMDHSDVVATLRFYQQARANSRNPVDPHGKPILALGWIG